MRERGPHEPSDQQFGDGSLLTSEGPAPREARTLIDVLYALIDPTGIAADQAKRDNTLVRSALAAAVIVIIAMILFAAFVVFCTALVLIAYFTRSEWAALGLGSVVPSGILGMFGLRWRRGARPGRR